MRIETVEQLDGLIQDPEKAVALKPTCLIITKVGKFLRGHIVDHNVRINTDGKVRGRIVFKVEGQNRDIDANDVTSLEPLK